MVMVYKQAMREHHPALGNEEQESVMMDSKRVMREHNPAWGCYYHQMGFAGVLQTWCADLNKA
jgi:hypothetical protein